MRERLLYCLEARYHFALMHDHLEEIGLGTYPDTIVPVHCLVHHRLLAGGLDGGVCYQPVQLLISEVTVYLVHGGRINI